MFDHCPESQLLQKDEPVPELLPASHAVQAADDELECEPALQTEQFAAALAEYVPALQLSQLDEPAAALLPASQSKHDLDPVADHRPATQRMQLAALVFDHVPPSHLVHVLLAADE